MSQGCFVLCDYCCCGCATVFTKTDVEDRLQQAVKRHNAPNADDLYVWLHLLDKTTYEDAAFKAMYDAYAKRKRDDESWTFTVSCAGGCCGCG